jgi:hypothetical protein
MVSVEVMILCYLMALIIAMNIVSMGSGYAQTSVNTTAITNSENTTSVNQTRSDLITNPNFTFFNDTSGLPSYWNDPYKNCRTTFSCTIKFTEGWNDYVSFSLSTTNNTNQTWSSIYGKEIEVKPKERYQLISHMKINNWVSQSHIALEGFNETLKKWIGIKQCPSGINGPLEWHEFSCELSIPENTTKIRAVLNAGWSSLPNKEATTWFDSIKVLKTLPA